MYTIFTRLANHTALSATAIFFVVVFVFSGASAAHAATPTGCLNGYDMVMSTTSYAWGAMSPGYPAQTAGSGAVGVGWISLAGSGGGSTYGICEQNGTGKLSGYAWSDRYGWLSFNPSDVAKCPAYPTDTTGTQCQGIDSGGTVTGWARFVSGETAGSSAGGWDGWVDLGASNGYGGVQSSGGCWTGWGWGGPVDTGWISFSGTQYSSCFTNTQPDLVATGVTPTTAAPNSAVTFTGTVTNAGTASTAGTFTDLFEISSTSNPVSFAAIDAKVPYNSSSLGAGNSNSPTGSYTFNTTGTWYVRLCADTNTSGTGSITESNENNNCSGWTTVTVMAPDLTTSAITPIAANVNTATTFTATVKNQGNASTGSTFTDLVQQAAAYNPANDTATGVSDVTTIANPILAANATQNVTFSKTFTTNGAYYFRVCADKSSAADTGTITESNENNNCGAWTTVTVGSPVATLQVSTSANGSNPQSSVKVAKGTQVYLDWGCTNATSASMSSSVTGTTPNGVVGSSGSNANLTSAPLQTSPINATTTFSINCTNSAGVKSSQTAEVDIGSGGGGGGGGTGSVSCAISLPASCASLPAGQPCSVAPGTDVTYNATVSNGGAAPYTWTSADGGGGPFGTTRTTDRTYNSQGTYGMSVNATNASTTTCPYVQVSTGGGSCSQTAQASISVNPARVLKNGSTQVTWGGQGVTSCSLSRNGAAWQNQSADPASCLATTVTTDASVASQTEYCVTCSYTDGSGNPAQTGAVCKTVNLIPGFSEF